MSLSNNSILYSVKNLMKIADANSDLHYQVNIKGSDVEVIFPSSEKTIKFKVVSFDKWHNLINKESTVRWYNNTNIDKNGLIRIETLVDGKVPSVFEVEEHEFLIEVNSRSEITINTDMISATLFMLSRWEETQDNKVDNHNRFPANQSVAYYYDFLNHPVVDEYAMIIRSCLKYLFPDWEPSVRTSRVILSHDIDQTYRFLDTKSALKTIIGGDLIKRRSLKDFLNSSSVYLKKVANLTLDPYQQGILDLLNLSLKYNFNSEFYFKTSDKRPYDSGDPIDEETKKIADKIVKDGHVIGFHPGYHTFIDFNTFISEKEKFDEIFGLKAYGGRQHYLRFKVPDTWYIWKKANLLYDSTMGYADYEGFRCGTCHPYKPYDIEKDQEIDITEIPLIIMDGTLKQYRGLSLQESLDTIVALAKTCKDNEGDFTLLWHNQSVEREWIPWFDMYKEALEEISRFW